VIPKFRKESPAEPATFLVTLTHKKSMKKLNLCSLKIYVFSVFYVFAKFRKESPAEPATFLVTLTHKKSMKKLLLCKINNQEKISRIDLPRGMNRNNYQNDKVMVMKKLAGFNNTKSFKYHYIWRDDLLIFITLQFACQ
jgi:hypothetical protein